MSLALSAAGRKAFARREREDRVMASLSENYTYADLLAAFPEEAA
jgi:hypothetical protein